MAKASLEERARKIETGGSFLKVCMNATWENRFYKYNGFFLNVRYKNGKLFDIVECGRK